MINFHIYTGQDETLNLPEIRKINIGDIGRALSRGLNDFWAMPSHLLFLGLLYPICGLILVYITSQRNALHLLFPLVSGFALIGPLAAIGLYEMSRRRELGLETNWKHALNVLRSPSTPSIVALGLALMIIFVLWLLTAEWLYTRLFGPNAPASLADLFTMVFQTREGWMLIGYGCFVGFCFAVVAMSISVVSFPMLLDRDAGAAVAVITSIRAVMANPVPMALWGMIVVAALVIGALLLLIGLAIVIPVLGHSTWHLYRAMVVRDGSERRLPKDLG